MSAALTLQQPRHLALPDACLFAPAALSIPSSISKSEFSRLGRALAQVGQSNDIWKADYALAAIEHFEKEEGLQLAHEATGLSKFFLYKASFVAKRFPPEHRLPGYKYSAYRELMPFPPEWAYAFLVRHADEKLSSKSLRALAVKEFGGEPYKAKQPKKRAVSIRRELYARLREHAPSQKVASFIETLLEDWLKALDQPVGDTEAAGNEPAATSRHPETSAATETPRPDYETRRKRQLAEGAQPITKHRYKKSKPHELRLQWTPCAKKISGNGIVRGANSRADCFRTLEDAQAAEEKYFQEMGYHNEIVYCVVPCGAYHVKHAYSGETQTPSQSS
ncbi:MAG: hypothetical protein ACYDDS_09240 [Candidatus Sulfotelmatobacter sp.]